MDNELTGLPTVTVDTLVDENDGNFEPGDLSLREALLAVASGGTIQFAAGLAAADVGFGQGVIALDSELVVDKSVTIEGLGADALTISGNGESRVFRLDDGDDAISSEVRIEGLTVADGVADIAGGILTAGENVTFVDMALNGNRGAIAATAAADISIERSSIFNSLGFGIQTLGELQVTDTQIINSDGVGIQHSGSLTGGSLTVERSVVANGAENGIVADGRLVLIDSQVASNGANGIILSAGDVMLQNSAVTGNQESGIASQAAVDVSLMNSTLESNGAGGIVTRGNTLVEGSSLANNGGDGVASDRVTMTRGIVFGNGGIGVLGRVVEIADSEISNNVGGNVVRTAEPDPDSPAPDLVKIGGNKEANILRGTAAAELIRGYSGNDRLNGKGGNDVLEGGNGDDSLIGGSGDDILGGGGGRDVMRGGAGRDTFVYTEITEGEDVILDFEVGRDLIDLSAILASGEAQTAQSQTGDDSAQPFDDYVKLSRVGSSTIVSVLDTRFSTPDTPVFTALAQLQNVDLAVLTAGSFVF